MKKLIALTIAVISLVGCDPTNNNNTTTTTTTNDTYTIVAGVENGYAGKCDGCLLDAKRMKEILSPYSKTLTYLTDKNANRQAVVNALTEGVKHDLCIFFYSGHGGSVKTYTDKAEVDGHDEYLCLYDRELLDNDIWNIIKNAKGRVFLMFDCCHSGTMFRAPITFIRQRMKLSATSKISDNISMICFSGCPDNTYSYGGSDGGEFTNAILRHFDANKSYDELWKAIESDKVLMKYEQVQRTLMGKSFGQLKIFR